MKPSPRVLRTLANREPRSTLALAACFTAPSRRDVRIIGAGSSFCVAVRSEPLVWLGYPQLMDPADAEELGGAIDRSDVVALDGHPDDVEPLLGHMSRVGETGRFRRMVTPRDECGWAASDDSTRIATPLDTEQVVDLFADYEVSFVGSARHRARSLARAVDRHGVVVHDGPGGIDAAGVMGGLTPQFMLLEHLRVAEHARGQGISWKVVSRIVEMAQAYGVGLLGSVVDDNPMTMPMDQGWMERQLSVNLRMPDRVRGERTVRRQLLRVLRRMPGATLRGY